MSEKNSSLIVIFPFLGLMLFAYITTKDTFLERERLDYEFYFTPTWTPLDDPHHSHLFDKTVWVLVGTFTIRMKEPSYLRFLSLKWAGHEPIEIHSASLYRGSGKTFKATDDYLIADGQWYTDATDQRLIFNFPYAEKLHVSNTLYLVLTITQHSESIINKGTFQILPDNFPGCLQRALKHTPIYLTLAPPISGLKSHRS